MVGKGGTAGFLGKAFDPYTLYPDGDDMDLAKMDKIRVDDLQLRPEVFSMRLERRAGSARRSTPGCRRSRRRSRITTSTSITTGPSDLVISGRAREAFNIAAEPEKTREMYGRNTFGQSCLLARRLVEAGTRVVEVVWPKVANSDNHSWDHHTGLSARMKDQSGPMLDAGLVRLLITDLDDRGMLKPRPWSWPSASSAGPRKRASAPRATATAPTAATTGRTATPPSWPGPGSSEATSTASPTRPAPPPLEDPVHPGELLATIYHAFGIDPATIVYNHLKQPRELVKAEAVGRLFA